MLLITGGVKSWSVVSALQEVGLEIVGTSVKKSTEEDKERVKELMGEDAHMFDDMPPREMYKMLKDAKADIMLSGGRSQFVALKAKMPWLDINQERHHAYAGYEGMVTLVQEIDKALYNPIWAQVRKDGTMGKCKTITTEITETQRKPDFERMFSETPRGRTRKLFSYRLFRICPVSVISVVKGLFGGVGINGARNHHPKNPAA